MGKKTDGDGQNVFAAEAVREDAGPAFCDSRVRVTEALKPGAWHTRNDLSAGEGRHIPSTRYVEAQLPAEATIGRVWPRPLTPPGVRSRLTSTIDVVVI